MEPIRHFNVPITDDERATCLGPDGSAAHVSRTLRMIRGRWKLPILFRLYAETSIRTLRLRRELPRVSQKVMTQQLRELEADGLVQRTDFGERRPHVEYRISDAGARLLHALVAVRDFSRPTAAR